MGANDFEPNGNIFTVTWTSASAAGNTFPTHVEFDIIRDCTGSGCADSFTFDVNNIVLNNGRTLGPCAPQTNPNEQMCLIQQGSGGATASGDTISVPLSFSYPGCCPDCGQQPRIRSFFQGGPGAENCAGGCIGPGVTFQYPICGQE